MMNKDIMNGKWKQMRGKAKEEWGKFTDHDLEKFEGKREQLVGLVQEKYGYSKEKAAQNVDLFWKKINIR